MAKVSQAQQNATNEYRRRSLETVNFVLSVHEQDIYEALQIIKARHSGNKSAAIKAAILEYAKMGD